MDGISGLQLNSDRLNFINHEGEAILLALRPHFLTLIPSLILLPFLILVFLAAVTVASIFLPLSLNSFYLISVVIVLGLFLLGKILLDWYFHFYFITDRKILELTYSPLAGCIINDILLDQVKCTEVDMQTSNLFYQFFDIGNIIITFDRPTHKQGFILENIKDYRKIGTYLGKIMVPQQEGEKKPAEAMWLRDKKDPSRYSYTEEIRPIRR